MIKNKKGFTLAELLIVVAIIAVLVSIAVPVFSSQLEKSREATDLANVRSAYGEVMSEVVTGNNDKSITVNLKQKKNDWQSFESITLGGIIHKKSDGDTSTWVGVPESGGTCTVSYSADSDEDGKADSVKFVWSGKNTVTYTDSKEVQEAKKTTQTSALSHLSELEKALQAWGKNYDKTTWNERLAALTQKQAKFTLSNNIVAWYKKSESDIPSLQYDKSKDSNVTFINFTLDDNGNIKIYNYCDANYSYSTMVYNGDSSEWFGSGVIK